MPRAAASRMRAGEGLAANAVGAHRTETHAAMTALMATSSIASVRKYYIALQHESAYRYGL